MDPVAFVGPLRHVATISRLLALRKTLPSRLLMTKCAHRRRRQREGRWRMPVRKGFVNGAVSSARRRPASTGARHTTCRWTGRHCSTHKRLALACIRDSTLANSCINISSSQARRELSAASLSARPPSRDPTDVIRGIKVRDQIVR